MSRFVILTHDYPRLHWDFLVECGDVLKSWRLPEVPRSGEALAAEAQDDHRLMYLDYEGPVSGGRGTVSRWDHGGYSSLTMRPDAVHLFVHGHKLRGVVELSHPATSPVQPGSQRREIWSFCFHES